MTSFVSVYVTEKIFTGREQCWYIATCQQSNERTVCNFNIWVPITVIFILLSVAFVVSFSFLIMMWKKHIKALQQTIIILTETGFVSSVLYSIT